MVLCLKLDAFNPSRFQLDSAVDLHDVVDRCPAHMTGADLYALCSDAMTAAIKRKIALIDDGEKTQKRSGFKVEIFNHKNYRDDHTSYFCCCNR